MTRENPTSETMAYRHNVVALNGVERIQIKDCPSKLWLNESVRTGRVWEDEKGWHAELCHMAYGDTVLGVVDSADGTAVLTVG